MILAGDIGGTKTVLTLVKRLPDGNVEPIKEQSLPSAQFSCFEELLTNFLPPRTPLASACLGVAGPVIDGRCNTTNLPWQLDTRHLRKLLGTPHVKLLNDLEAMALGMLYLNENELLELNPKAQPQSGNKAVIAAGTGLGEAVLVWTGERYYAMATEGGHSDFAPQNAHQDTFLSYLRTIYPDHVSWERVVSGMGISHLYDFLSQSITGKPIAGEGDRNAFITEFALRKEDALCMAVINEFIGYYGTEAGNLALKSFANGGIFIGGGIASKMLPAFEGNTFLNAFKAKGRFEPWLGSLSVKIALNPKTPLLGAMHFKHDTL